MKKVLCMMILGISCANAEQVAVFGGLSTGILFNNWGGHLGIDVPVAQFPNGGFHARVSGEYTWSSRSYLNMSNTYAVSADGVVKFGGDEMVRYGGITTGYTQNEAAVSGVFLGVLGGGEWKLSNQVGVYAEGVFRNVFVPETAYNLGLSVRFGVRFGL